MTALPFIFPHLDHVHTFLLLFSNRPQNIQRRAVAQVQRRLPTGGEGGQEQGGSGGEGGGRAESNGPHDHKPRAKIKEKTKNKKKKKNKKEKTH